MSNRVCRLVGTQQILLPLSFLKTAPLEQANACSWQPGHCQHLSNLIKIKVQVLNISSVILCPLSIGLCQKLSNKLNQKRPNRNEEIK